MAFEDLDLEKAGDEKDGNQALAQKIEDYYKQDISDKFLRATTWDEAIRFVDGDQHIEYNATINRFQQTVVSRNNDFIPRPITNYILPAVRTIVSQLTKQKPQAKVRPNSQNPVDIAAAKLGDLVLDSKWEELREDEKTQEKAVWGVVVGTIFKKIFWNETTTKQIRIPKMEMVQEPILDEMGNPTPKLDDAGNPMLDAMGMPMPETQEVEKPVLDKNGEQAFDEYDVGDVDSCLVPPFNIAMPLNARSPLELDWIMEYSVQKLTWIKEQYGKTGEGYTGQADKVTEEKELSIVMQLEYRLRTLVGRRSGGGYATGSAGYIDITNSAVLKEYYSKPTKEYPRGRMIVVASGKTLFNGDNPYYEDGTEDSWNPYVEWRFDIVPGRAWGKGLVDELVPPQRRINAIDALIILNRKTMAISQWLIPEGSGVPNGYINGRPGLMIPYRPVGANGAKPEKVPPVPLPAQVYQERDQAVDDMKRLAMTQDVLEGSNPQGVKTAYQLEQLLENAVASMGSIFQRWEKSLEREETKKLALIAKRYKEPRANFGKKLKALNKDITDIDLDMFLGADLRDNVSVRVEPDSSIPRSKAGENAILREMVQNGALDLLKNSVNRREFMDKMGIKGFDYESSPDVKRAQWENSIIENGDLQNLVIDETGASVLELDDHETHIIIHSARMKDPNISLEIRKKYKAHIEEHLQFLSTGIQANQDAGVAGSPGETKVNQTSQEQAAETVLA